MKIASENTTIRVIFLSVFISLSPMVAQRVAASPPGQGITEAQGIQNTNAVLKYLLPVLKSEGKAGRLYYNATCQSGANGLVAFPLIDVQQPPTGATGLAAVRDVFPNEKNVSVSERQSTIIDIEIGKVPDAILKTKISVLNLKPIEQYNYAPAVNAVENNRQVRMAMHKLGFRTPAILFNDLLTPPAEGLPHLPPSMLNLTMDQALDAVANTFGGIVLYGVCTQPQLYTVSFAEE